MQERHVHIDTPDGKMETFISAPDGKGPFPGIIIYQNVGGFSDMMRDIGRRVTRAGYYCAVPDLYYRLGRIVIDPDSEDPDTVKIRNAVTSTMRSNDRAMKDTCAILEFMDRDSLVSRNGKGCIGFCMGGRFAVYAAGTLPNVFKASASLYGTRLITDQPDSPHLVLKSVTGELYCGFAENDIQTPTEVNEKFAALIKEANVKGKAEFHPGSEHGYAFPTRKTYNKDAAELSWQRIFDMFQRQLRP